MLSFELWRQNDKPIRLYLNTQITEGSSTRLPFGELCAFYAALVDGVPPRIVCHRDWARHHLCRLSQSRRNLPRRSNPLSENRRRVPSFSAASPLSTAMSPPKSHDRIRVAGDQVKRARLEPKPFAGVNPRASKFASVHTLKDPARTRRQNRNRLRPLARFPRLEMAQTGAVEPIRRYSRRLARRSAPPGTRLRQEQGRLRLLPPSLPANRSPNPRQFRLPGDG